MATLYLDRDNASSFRLEVDGATVTADVVTRVTIYFPANATVSGTALTVDSAVDPELTISADATEITLKGGTLDLKPGRYVCDLSVFDVVNTNGIAWDQINVKVNDWRP